MTVLTGGFGTVTSAQAIFCDSKLTFSDWFAVKEIKKKDVLKHKTGVNMLYAELDALQQLTHPFIVTLHLAFNDSTSCFLVLDLLLGGDLRYYLKNGLVFDEYSTAIYAACISSALEHMHSKFILHRDIKPENILLDDRGFPYLTG